MEKKKPYGRTPKERHLAAARDKLFSFLLAGGAVRGAVLNGTRMVNEMRANHELGILETVVLGRAYLGAALMSAALKGADRLSLRIDCSGPIQGLVVEANAFGEVRGYLKKVPIPIAEPPQDLDLSRFFGAGILTVTRFLEDGRRPFSGQVELRYGNLALDLAHYHLVSEQIPTAFDLSIAFDREGEVTGAGGLLLQAMPPADETLAAELEQRIVALPSIGEALGAGKSAEQLVSEEFADYGPKMLAGRRVEFMCHCSRERLAAILALLPAKDLAELRDNGPFPVEMRCHNCNTAYAFDRPEIEAIYGRRRPDN
jgi:molecular chaperone Hsp33